MYYGSGNYEAFAHAKKPEGIERKKAIIIGGGLAGLSAAAFLVRDAKMPGKNITVMERRSVSGGSCDGMHLP
ncbi:MAG TPA: oleate hydratase, partial [Clostridiales bacterium]|nr:oleate hydratase [Clostridiales bacterium]